MMDLDDAFRQVGEYGVAQKRVFWSMAIPQAFVAWHHLHNVFIGAEPQFYCLTGVSGGDKQIEGCPKTDQETCASYSFPGMDFTSIVSEWNLVCSEAYKSDIVQSVYMAGLLAGNLIGGAIADQYGRRRQAYVSMLAITVCSILALMSHSYTAYVTWRFLAGLFTGAYGLVSFTLPTELVGSEQRGFVNVSMTISFALGVGIFSPMAYFIRDWRLLSFVTALPGLLGIYYYRVVPESPRWLYSQGRVDEAEKVLTSIALINNGRLPADPIKLKPPAYQPTRLKQAGIMDIVRHPTLRNNTLNNVYTWFVNAAVYYGLTMRAGSLGSDKYVSIALAGLIEIPADLLTLYLMDKYGRRYTYSWSMLFGGTACVAIILLPPGHSYLLTTLALLGKIGISMSFCVCWMHAAEMYPTSIRNKALSIYNMSSRLGGVMSPMILTLGKLYANSDFVIFGGLTFVAGLVSLRLPETLNRPMAETVDDVDSSLSFQPRITHSAPTDFSKAKLLHEIDHDSDLF